MAVNLVSLRPADATPAAIAAAIERCHVAHNEALAGLSQSKCDRRALLLGGTDAQLLANERNTARAEDDAERIGALAEELEARLVTAREDEARAEYAALVATYNDTQRSFVARWQAEYPALAAGIRDLLLLEREADRLLDQIREERQRGAVAAFPPDDPDRPTLADDRHRLFGGNWTMGSATQLPSVNGAMDEDSPWFNVNTPPRRSRAMPTPLYVGGAPIPRR